MDYLPHFHREIVAFEAAIGRVAGVEPVPLVPSCPDWSVSDLAIHLGGVHRFVSRILRDRLTEPPDTSDLALYGLPPDLRGWPMPEQAPNRGPMPAELTGWFADGAAELAARFRSGDPAEPVWTWAPEQTVGFWLRMQTIEAAVHRWDAENTTGTAQPVEAELAADAVAHTFEVMAPSWRTRQQAPPGTSESFRLRQTDGPGDWTVQFEGDDIRLTDNIGSCDVELAGPASDLMLFLWHRIPADRLDLTGDREVLDRFFVLVPPM